MIEAEALKAAGGAHHGFFTRQGGVSHGLFASRNCGFGSGDNAAQVAENRSRAMSDLGVDSLVTAYQCHSARCVTVTEPWAPGNSPRADAMTTSRPGVALGILTADCAPVLFADRRARVIAAAHAGWRGALDGVVEAAFDAMAALGATAGETVAAVGPCIGQASYEVGPEFREAFVTAHADNAGYFVPSTRPGHHMFDLAGYVAGRLGGLGLASVEVLGLDTCADEARFFSYRRACHAGEDDYGRLISLVALEDE
jgi:YfiH family protein